MYIFKLTERALKKESEIRWKWNVEQIEFDNRFIKL